MEIHQVLAGAALGDAITNEALELQKLFRRVVPSEVFSHHRDTDVIGRIHHISEYRRYVRSRPSQVLLMLHTSIAEPNVFQFIMRRRERVVVRYHNITPASFFEPYDPSFASLLERGRIELAALRDRAAFAIADSRYNESELHDLGYRDTTVIPLLTHLDQLLDAPRISPPWLAPRFTDCDDDEDGPIIAFVGRLSPNKGHLHCLRAQHVLQTYHAPRARLVLAGGTGPAAYQALLRHTAAEMGLDVNFTGKISVAELAAVYRRADAFLCMSEHEGFCVPLVEAMAFDVPIVAWAATAVPETLAGAGIVLDEPDPALAAEAVWRVAQDTTLRRELAGRGRRRYAELSAPRVEAMFLDTVTGLLR